MRCRRVLALLSLLLPLSTAGPAEAGPPTEQLKSDIPRVFRVLAGLGETAERQARHDALRGATRGLIDLPEIARQTLGRHWNERSEGEREDFLRRLDVLVHTQIAALAPYSGATIHYAGEAVEGDLAVVRTRVVGHGRDLSLDYRLVRRGDRWLIWDVEIDHASLVGFYRAQFHRVIRAASYATLVEKLAAQ
jgi:phospholipid transport system substrate-binding protein